MISVGDGSLICSSMNLVDMTGLASIGAEDPEPKFVDINDIGETVLTLQENNHISVVDQDGKIISHFSAGATDLEKIDALDERGALIFNGSQKNRLQEPDGIQWLNNDLFTIANEGVLDGGSRGFKLFKKDGILVYESGANFEHALIEIGHYPDKRSDAKGLEPEGMEFTLFDGRPFMFLLSERGSVVGVYDMSVPSNPVLEQLLPSGLSPEGAIALPKRNIIATANEADLVEDAGVSAHVMIYEYQDAPASYPALTSGGASELIGWGAISGMVAKSDVMIYVVNGSFYGYQPTILVIDPSSKPVRMFSEFLSLVLGILPRN